MLYVPKPNDVAKLVIIPLFYKSTGTHIGRKNISKTEIGMLLNINV